MSATFQRLPGFVTSSNVRKSSIFTTVITCTRESPWCTSDPSPSTPTAGLAHPMRAVSTNGAMITSAATIAPLLQRRPDAKGPRRTWVLRSLPTNLAAAGRSGSCTSSSGPRPITVGKTRKQMLSTVVKVSRTKDQIPW